jgi:peptidoglycan/xylan/chitin deacetylase (PgdA/CDA1 family)
MDEFAAVLEEQGLTGAFFLTAEELADYPTLCNRLTAKGHTVGLWLDGDDTNALEQANALADSQTKQPLLWVYAPDGGDAAADLGYLVLTPDDGGDTVLWETDCAQGAATVAYCQDNNYTMQTLRETTVFPVS